MAQDFTDDEVCFVPDSQIIFPSVFLSNVSALRPPNCTYKICFELLTQNCNYVILPSNYTDFSRLIIKKMPKFLKLLEEEISKARANKTPENEFYTKTRRVLVSHNIWERGYGDLILYWESNKQVFWEFVSIDLSLVRRKLLDLTLDKMRVFAKICEGHQVEFSEEEEKLSEGLYILIKDAKRKRTIQHSANDEDLMILAECFIYKNMRFLEGFVYLVTDDKELFGTTAEVVTQPYLIFPDFKQTEKFMGFEPLKPEKFVAEYNRQSHSA